MLTTYQTLECDYRKQALLGHKLTCGVSSLFHVFLCAFKVFDLDCCFLDCHLTGGENHGNPAQVNKTKVQCEWCGRLFQKSKLKYHQTYFCGPEAQRTEKQMKAQRKADYKDIPEPKYDKHWTVDLRIMVVVCYSSRHVDA